MTDLPPSLQEVKNAFMTTYSNGGIEACRTMVADLAQEAGLTEAVADGTQAIDDETIELQTILPPEEIVSRLEFTTGVIKDHTTAISRHSLALFLLGVVDKPKD